MVCDRALGFMPQNWSRKVVGTRCVYKICFYLKFKTLLAYVKILTSFTYIMENIK